LLWPGTAQRAFQLMKDDSSRGGTWSMRDEGDLASELDLTVSNLEYMKCRFMSTLHQMIVLR